jgi:hypothetical protein
VRGVALWTLLTSLAFLVTAAAFLLLASLGGDSESAPIPRADPSETRERPTLSLKIPEDQLERLERETGQRLTLDLENGGEEDLADVTLSLDVVSENTARPHARSYRETLEQLAPGETASVEFEINLSPPAPAGAREFTSGAESQYREIIEARASASGDASDVKTAVLAP